MSHPSCALVTGVQTWARPIWIRYAGIDRIRLGLVAVEADQGELRGVHHSGRDLADPDRLADQLQAQGLGDHLGAVLGRDIAGAGLVRRAPRGRADVHDQAVLAGAQGRPQAWVVCRMPRTLPSYICFHWAGSAVSTGSTPNKRKSAGQGKKM